MIQKDMHRLYSPENRKNKTHGVSPEKIFLFSGEFVLLFVLLYLVITNGGANEAIHLWVPFVLAGIALFITSRLIK
jgi:hypothetical protein